MTQNKKCPFNNCNCDWNCAWFKDMDYRFLFALEDFAAAVRERREQGGKLKPTGYKNRTINAGNLTLAP